MAGGLVFSLEKAVAKTNPLLPRVYLDIPKTRALI